VIIAHTHTHRSCSPQHWALAFKPHGKAAEGAAARGAPEGSRGPPAGGRHASRSLPLAATCGDRSQCWLRVAKHSVFAPAPEALRSPTRSSIAKNMNTWKQVVLPCTSAMSIGKRRMRNAKIAYEVV